MCYCYRSYHNDRCNGRHNDRRSPRNPWCRCNRNVRHNGRNPWYRCNHNDLCYNLYHIQKGLLFQYV